MMRTIRDFEERVHEEFAGGDIPGFVHLYAGEEASAAGVCLHLTTGTPSPPPTAATATASPRGVGRARMMAEIYGKSTGSCKGKGGSMHIADLSKGMLGANGIVGGGPPLICGPRAGVQAARAPVAWPSRSSATGPPTQGTTLESLNLATVWNLPASSSRRTTATPRPPRRPGRWPPMTSPTGRPRSAWPGVIVDGFDFFAVHEAAGEAVARAREGGGPTLIEVKFTRYFGHFEVTSSSTGATRWPRQGTSWTA